MHIGRRTYTKVIIHTHTQIYMQYTYFLFFFGFESAQLAHQVQQERAQVEVQ